MSEAAKQTVPAEPRKRYAGPIEMLEDILGAGKLRYGPDQGQLAAEHWHRFFPEDQPILKRCLNMAHWLRHDDSARQRFLKFERGEG